MDKILDDVRKDAMKKCRITGEEDKKRLTAAAVLMLEIGETVRTEGMLAVYKYIEKKTVNEFLKRILRQMSEGTDAVLTFEAAANEYWEKDPQGILAMVFYIYLLGADYIYSGYPSATVMESLRTLLPEGCHEKFDRRVEKINNKRKKCKQKQQKQMYLFKQKEALQRQEAEKLLHSPPVIINKELLEIVHALEEEIGKLPDLSFEKVLNEMEFEILCDCFYVLSDESRQRILDNYDSFASRLRSFEYMDYVIGRKGREEEEVLGAVFVLSGTMKRLQRQESKGKQSAQKFYAARPVFHNPKLLEKLHELEKELIENLSDLSIDAILRQEDYRRRSMINRCLYGLSNQAQLKIFNCGYGRGLFEVGKSRRMEEVAELGEQEEEEILGAVLMMLGTIKRLRRIGKLKES